MDDGFNKVIDGELFKWEKEGTSIMGLLQRYDHRESTGKGEGHIYEVKTKDGVAAFFAPFILQKKLSSIPIGSIVKITFTETTKTSSGNTIKHFDVGFIKKGEAMYDAKLKELGVDEFNSVADEGKPAVEGKGMVLDDGVPM